MERGESMCAQPSVEERLQRMRGDINALYRLIPDELERQRERERRDRWHATYNAALQRHANFSHSASADPNDVKSSLDYVHLQCVRYADRAHGPLCAVCEPETTSEAGAADTVSSSDDAKNA